MNWKDMPQLHFQSHRQASLSYALHIEPVQHTPWGTRYATRKRNKDGCIVHSHVGLSSRFRSMITKSQDKETS